MNRKIVIISHKNKIDEGLLKEKRVVDEIRFIQKADITKENIEFYINKHKLTTNDLIIIHSSQNLKIDDYNIVYFSFGCSDCGEAKKNGEILKETIKDISLSNKPIEFYKKRLFDLISIMENKKNMENEIFVDKHTHNIIDDTPNNYYLYISDILQMCENTLSIFQKLKIPPLIKDDIPTNSEKFIYLVVPFAGYGYPNILDEKNIENINISYSDYFLELKELQEQSNYNIIFLFMSYNESYIPNFFKETPANKTIDRGVQSRVDKIFLSPLKKFNQDSHSKFLFAEMIYSRDKKILNFFTFGQQIDISPINNYLTEDLPYKELKKFYYQGLFFDKDKFTEKKANESCGECWEFHKKLKHQDKSNNTFHNIDMLDIRTNMPFYSPSMFNKLKIIKETFRNQKLDFLLVDDKDTIDTKYTSIDNILKIILGEGRYKLEKEIFKKKDFTKERRGELISLNKKQNIRNSNFILLDFILDPIDDGGDGVFFGSDFIEWIEKLKKEKDEQFRTWYFITSYLSSYVHKFEIDKILYEYYDSATIHLGDSTNDRFIIFFIKKLIYFIYSKVNIYIRLIDITKQLQDVRSDNLMKKLIVLMQTLLQQIDLLELRYENKIEIAEQFYALSSHILQDYLLKVELQWEIKEIKFQEIKRLHNELSIFDNKEITNIYKLIETLSFKGRK